MTTLILPNGQRIEFTPEVHPHKYIDVHLAIDGWLQTFSLDSTIDAWWLAQKRRAMKEARRVTP